MGEHGVYTYLKYYKQKIPNEAVVRNHNFEDVD